MALLVLAVLGLFAGVAAAEMGYGVGDGTGPIATQPQDGTGEQHQAPPPAVVDNSDGVVPPGSEVAPLREQEQVRTQEQLRLQEQDATCDPEQLREREQLRLEKNEQVQPGTQTRVREREQVRSEEHLADGSCDPACDGDQDRDRVRQHTDS